MTLHLAPLHLLFGCFVAFFFFASPGACADSVADSLLSTLDEDVRRAITADFRELGILNAENRLSQNATLQSFVDRDANANADADVNVDDSILGVLWPTRDNNYSFTFAFYLPSESQGIHAMHVCGFLFANECLNEKPFPGKPFGRCGESGAGNAPATGFLRDFLQPYGKTEPKAGVFASGTESLERLGAHVESFGEDALTSIELHVDLVALGDYGAAPPPGGARRLLALRGPTYAGMHMTLRAGPGRRSFITLPGALGG